MTRFVTSTNHPCWVASVLEKGHQAWTHTPTWCFHAQHMWAHQFGLKMVGLWWPIDWQQMWQLSCNNQKIILFEFWIMFFMEITILSMLFSHTRSGGVNWVLQFFADSMLLSKIPDTPCLLVYFLLLNLVHQGCLFRLPKLYFSIDGCLYCNNCNNCEFWCFWHNQWLEGPRCRSDVIVGRKLEWRIFFPSHSRPICFVTLFSPYLSKGNLECC